MSVGRRLGRLAVGTGKCVCVLSWVSMLAACSDPNQTEPNIAPGEPQVALGYLQHGDYIAWEPGSDAPVIWGAQGGTWLMPVLRTRGVASPTRVEASLTLSDGEQLGEFEFVYGLSMTPDEWLETQLFRVPVQHAPPHQFESVADLYGKPALIAVHVSDDAARSADLAFVITLVEGD
ncbi:MAG TPA: hypothetical protein VFU02_23815 [Polyangiaceae bacterium]|nr:hypothetical protein [Polyangiaceae bacterium]